MGTMGAVILKPGVNTQMTPALNEAGISQSQLIRFKGQMLQTYGGWQQLFPGNVGPVPRDLHPWAGRSGNKFLSIAGTNALTIYNLNDGSLKNITPETRTSDTPPSVSISSGSFFVSINDPNSGVSVFDTVFIATPISIGNLYLTGAYPVISVGSTGQYSIQSSVAASTTINSSGALPIFTTTAGSATVNVLSPNSGVLSIPGLFYDFIPATSVGGLNIQGQYSVTSIIDSTSYTINATEQSTGNDTQTMNGGLAEYTYYIAIGPQSSGSGFGEGGFGTGGFGTGSAISGEPGDAITATDWTQDNWGEILLACPENGAIYSWSANSGLLTAQIIPGAPVFNGGIFVAMPQQILVAWASANAVGTQDKLRIKWSDQENYTVWAPNNDNSAGGFTLSNGSYIVGGMQCPSFALISTDVDVWLMQYVGGTVIFNFSKLGSGCGWVSSHACGVLSGVPYWLGNTNFYMMGGVGVVPLPCDVWDAIFQNMNTAFRENIRCAVNTSFNEVMWLYPSATSVSGENDSYVKVHIEGNEYEWDYGLINRSAWTDISIAGQPIGADPQGFLWQHETGVTISGASLPSFRTGWWAITEGNDLSFVDFVMPDFQWGTRSGPSDAQVAVTFFSLDYPGDTPNIYGPFIVTQQTEYINPRLRGRLMSMQFSCVNSEFVRLGRVRYRYTPAGRR